MSNEEKVHFLDEEKEECVIKTESYSTVNNPVQSLQNGNKHNQTTEISWRRFLAQLPPGIVFTSADRPIGKIIATSTTKLAPALREVQIQTTIGLTGIELKEFVGDLCPAGRHRLDEKTAHHPKLNIECISAIIGYKQTNQENRTLKKSSFGIYVFQKVKSDQKTPCDCKRNNLFVCSKRSPTVATDNKKTDKNIKPAHTGVSSEKEAKKKASDHACACSEGKDHKIDKRLIMMSSDRCKKCNREQRSASVTSICIDTLLNEVLIYLNQLTSEHLNTCLRCNRKISSCHLDATTSNQPPDTCKESLFLQARAYLAQLTSEHKSNCDRCKQKQNTPYPTESSSKPSGNKTESVLQRAWSYIQSFRSESKNCCERCKELGLPVCCKHINSANGKNLCNYCKPKSQPEFKRSSTEISNKGSCQRCKTVQTDCIRQSSDEKLNEVGGPPYKTSQPICNKKSLDENSNKGSCKRCKSAQVACRRQSSGENFNKGGHQPCKTQSSDENLNKSFCLRCKSAQVACGRQSSEDNLNKGSCLPCKKRSSDKKLKKNSKQLAEPACLPSPKDSCCSHCLQGGKQVCCIHALQNETESNGIQGILGIKGWLESPLKPISPAEKVCPEHNSCPKFCSKSTSQESAVDMPRCRSAVPQRQCSSYLSHSKTTTFTPCCKHSSQPCATGCKTNCSNLSVNSPHENNSCSGQRQKSSLQSLIDCFSRTSSVEDVKKSSRSRSGCEYLDYHSSTQCSGPVQNDCPKPKQGLSLTMEPNDHKFCTKPDCKHSLEADACPSLPLESHDPACDGACREKEKKTQGVTTCDIETEEPQSSGAEDCTGVCVKCDSQYSASGSIYQEQRMVDAEYEAFLDNHFGRMVAQELANKGTICDNESCNCITCITKLPPKNKKSGPEEDLQNYRYYY